MKIVDNIDLSEDKKCINRISIKKEDVLFNDNTENDINDDYKYSRKKIHNIIEISESVLDYAVENLNLNDGSARNIEAVTALIKTICDSTEKLVSLHEKIKKITPHPPKESKDEEGKPKTVRATVNEIIDGMS